MERFPMMNDGNINISDVLDAIETTDPSFAERNRTNDVDMISGGSCIETRPQATAAVTNRSAVPYVEIIEQPASKALRFRYECEGRSAGSIPGVNSTSENKTFPAIRIVGYKGRAIVVVSCVTKDPPYRPHPHNLVGKEVCRKGVCTVEISSENMTVSFDKLGIQCVKRKDIEEALRLREEIRVDPFRTGFDHKRQPTSIDLNAVRLCFQVFVEGKEKGKCTVPLQAVVSEPIFDKKAMSDLVICKLSHCSASVAGGTEMVLLCEKVAKEDIQVRFFEERDGLTYWEGFGDFQPTHVHKQVAIAFRTPSYKTQQVDQPVQAFIQLRRPSDGAMSEPLHFQLLPLGLGRPSQLWSLRKAFARKKAASEFNRVVACADYQLPARSNRPSSRFFDHNEADEFNNNNNNNHGLSLDSLDEFLNARRSYNKLSALRALSEIYNVQRNDLENRGSVHSQGKKAISPTYDTENNNSVIIENINDESTDVAEKNCSVYEQNVNKINGKSKSDWRDYSEVGKWVKKSQEVFPKETAPEEITIDTPITNGDKSLDELLTQVVELDKIYEDTQAKLLKEKQHNTQANNGIESDVPDNQTYTSLQLAMKNPVWVRVNRNVDKEASNVGGTVLPSPIIAVAPDAAPPRPPPPVARIKRDVSIEAEGPVPPLPPKRIRKTPSMPVLPRAASNQVLTEQQQQQAAAPTKTLPIPPNNNQTQLKQAKPGLFSKLFSKKTKKEQGKVSPRPLSSTSSLPGLSKESLQPIAAKLPPVRALASSQKSLELEGDQTPPYGVELTEAEHYALYTAMAPHATASEFDEMSFYYSPVEGGKILVEGKENA